MILSSIAGSMIYPMALSTVIYSNSAIGTPKVRGKCTELRIDSGFTTLHSMPLRPIRINPNWVALAKDLLHDTRPFTPTEQSLYKNFLASISEVVEKVY